MVVRCATLLLSLAVASAAGAGDASSWAWLGFVREGGAPLKLVRTLRRLSLYPCSFSKFATAYTQEMMQQNQNLLQQKHLAMPPEEVAAAQRGITPVWNEYLAFAARYKEKRAGMAGSSNIAGMAGTVSMAGASGTI